MSQDGGCHLGVEWSPSCHHDGPGHNGHCGLMAGHRCPAFYCRLQGYLISCSGPGQHTADKGKVLMSSMTKIWACDDECIMYSLPKQLQWSLYMQRGSQQASNLEQLPTYCSLQGCAVTQNEAECVPHSECLSSVCQYLKKIFQYKQTSAQEWVKLPWPGPMKAAETPDRAPSTALFVHKVLPINQGLSLE